MNNVHKKQIKSHEIRFRYGGNFLPNRLLNAYCLNDTDRILYIKLLYLSTSVGVVESGKCFRMHLSKIADEMGHNRDTVKKSLDKLVEHNIISVNTSSRPWTFYFIHPTDWRI